jgi:hypothetical protein
MSNHTYDYPLHRPVDLGTVNAVVRVPGQSGKYNRVKVVDATALVGSTPAAVTVSIGDGTDVDRYGTITVAAGGTANESADITLNLTDANFEIFELESLVFTNTTAPAGAVTDFKVFIGYF